MTSLSDSGYGSGRRNVASTIEKIGVTAPMLSAMMSSATAVKPRLLRRDRIA
jgi:hypothetical protein